MVNLYREQEPTLSLTIMPVLFRSWPELSTYLCWKEFQKTDGFPEFSSGIDEITEFFMTVDNIPWNGGVLFNVTRPADIVGV